MPYRWDNILISNKYRAGLPANIHAFVSINITSKLQKLMHSAKVAEIMKEYLLKSISTAKHQGISSKKNLFPIQGNKKEF